MIKTKDNLTDLVEALPKVPPADQQTNNPDQQVVNSNGQTITLGQRARNNLVEEIYRKTLKLWDKYMRS
jgi:hypothetical protein